MGKRKWFVTLRKRNTLHAPEAEFVVMATTAEEAIVRAAKKHFGKPHSGAYVWVTDQVAFHVKRDLVPERRVERGLLYQRTGPFEYAAWSPTVVVDVQAARGAVRSGDLCDRLAARFEVRR